MNDHPILSAWRENRLLVSLALYKLLIHFLTNSHYGYFIDEYYYVACSNHLAFGYVDQPPLIALITKLTIVLFGQSLFGLRFFPAVAGAVTVFVTGLIVKEFGGGKFAQLLACIAMIVSPLPLLFNTLLTMNAFDVLFWSLAVYVALRAFKTDSMRSWIWLGVILGIGLQNKISVLFLGFGLFVGLLMTPERRFLKQKGTWIAAAIAGVIFLPYIIWEMQNGWPTLEFIHNASLYKNRPQSPLLFLAAHALEFHPFNVPLLIFGLFFFFFSSSGKPYRLFGWVYVATLGLFLLTQSKSYYLLPVFPLMLAGGAITIETMIEHRGRGFWKPSIITLLLIGGVITAPFTLPVLPVETYVSYQNLLGITPVSSEQKAVGKLPQHFADMFGGEELVAVVAGVYRTLTPQERDRCAIAGIAYPQAGAIDFFGPKYGLPKAISAHNNYWIWGPGDYTGEVMIVVGWKEEDLRKEFDSVTLAAVFHHEYVMPWENNFPVYVCRGIKHPLRELWPKLKMFI